ncbi:hypothetical protein IG631_08447 [Alternaria alternata]|jgi:hypothetical protein|nr:hypothetical protein IG631_08447 [Alternaria alternata]
MKRELQSRSTGIGRAGYLQYMCRPRATSYTEKLLWHAAMARKGEKGKTDKQETVWLESRLVE